MEVVVSALTPSVVLKKKKKVVPESDCDRNDGARKAEEIRDHRSKEMG